MRLLSFQSRRPPLSALLAVVAGCMLPGSPSLARVWLPESILPDLAASLDRVAVEPPPQAGLWLGQQDEAEGQRLLARSVLQPKISAYAQVRGAYETRSDIDDRWRIGANAGINAQQPLWQGGALTAQVDARAAEAVVRSTWAHHARQEFLDSVRSRWIEWHLVALRQQVLNQSRSLLDGLLTTRRALRDLGQASELDIVELEVQIAHTDDDLAWWASEAARLADELAWQLGFQPALIPQPLDVVLANGLPDVAAVAAAVPQWLVAAGAAPAVERAEQERVREVAQLRVADTARTPRFGLVAGLAQDQLEGVNTTADVTRWTGFVGLRVDWNLFDGRASDGHALQARGRVRSAEARADTTRGRLENWVTTAAGRMDLHIRRAQTQQARLQSLERRQALVLRQVEDGFLPMADVVQAERDTAQARVALIDNMLQFHRMAAELAGQLGIDPRNPVN
jgi:outer membrane protein TolC